MAEAESTGRFTVKEVVMPITLLVMTTIFSGFSASASKEQERIKACREIISGLTDAPEQRPKTIALYALLKRYDPEAAQPLEGWFAELSLNHAVALMQDGRKQEAVDFAKSVPTELLKSDGAGAPEKLVDKAGAIADAKTWEKSAWDRLAEGKVDEAKEAFQKSEKAYPTFRQAFEISKYIDAHHQALADPATKEGAIKSLVEKHIYSAPKALKNRFGLPGAKAD